MTKEETGIAEAASVRLNGFVDEERHQCKKRKEKKDKKTQKPKNVREIYRSNERESMYTHLFAKTDSKIKNSLQISRRF